MLRHHRLVVAALSAFAAVCGAAFMTLATFWFPANLGVRGAVIGFSGGLFGTTLLFLGLILGSHRNACETEPSERAQQNGHPAVVSPDEAKFWLQRFFEEHQKRGDRPSEG